MASKITPSRVADGDQADLEDALAQAAGMHVAALPVDRIDADRNIRDDLGDLSELTASIRQLGVLQPIAVTPTGEDRYEVAYGHRRLEAAREAGLTVIPAIVRAPVEEPERIATMIVENLHRRDLSPLEEARAFQALRDLGLSQRDTVSRVGRSQAHVSKRLSLLKLTAAALAALDSGGITVDDALTLTKLADHPVELDEALAAGSDPKSYSTVASQVDRRLRQIEISTAREAAFATLNEQGVHLVDDGRWWQRQEKVIGQGYAQFDVDANAHAGEPCHAAAVDATGDVLLVCLNPDRHLDVAEPVDQPADQPVLTVVPDPDPGAPSVADDSPSVAGPPEVAARTPEVGASALKVVPPPPPPPLTPEEEQARAQREAERAERDRRNAEAEQARTRRADTMRGLVQAKVSRTKALDFILRQLVSAALADHGELAVCTLLGLEPATPGGWAPEDEPYAVERYADTSSDRLLRVALGVALAYGEPDPRFPLDEAVTANDVQRHYRFLQGNGYELAEIETTALATPAGSATEDHSEAEDSTDS